MIGGGGRVGGIDAARALAIVGMVMVHVGPTDEDGVVGTLYRLPHGRAAILFALLAGIGVAFLTQGTGAGRPEWARLSFRTLLLLPAGLALQMLDTGVLVILQFYAVFYLVVGAASWLGDRVLLGTSLAWFLVGPVVFRGLRELRPGWSRGAPSFTDPPLAIARQIFLIGTYPVLTWSAVLLFGLWLGRRNLRDPKVARRMVAWGIVGVVAAYALSWALRWWLDAPPWPSPWLRLFSDRPHSQMPLWLIGATASATVVLGACLLVVERLPRVSWPFVAAGQLALTVYVGHLFVLHFWTELLRRPDAAGAAVRVAVFTVIVGAAAMVWRRFFERGPLEVLLRLPWMRRGR